MDPWPLFLVELLFDCSGIGHGRLRASGNGSSRLCGDDTARRLRRERLGAACSLRRSLELVLVVGAARRERRFGAAKGVVDILLEIILKEGEGPDKPGEVLL